MLLKWIVCKVHSEMKTAFSRAQEQWQSINKAEGFLGQFGGWDTQHEHASACILGLWRSRSAHDKFMRQMHHQVTDVNNQAQTYQQISVELFESKLSIMGPSGTLSSAFSKGQFLRVAECQVKDTQVDHFIQVQKSIWIPGMVQANGMLGGSFNQSTKASHSYLVTTIWDSVITHDRYVREKLPVLRQESAVADDTESVVGRFIRLEETWSIRPSRR